MNAYVVYLDETATDATLRWSMFTVPGVASIKHDDRIASLYGFDAEQRTVLIGIVRLSENVSVVLADEPPQLGGFTEAPPRTLPARPVVTAIAPSGGRLAGGTQVEIQGQNLLDATGVFFGANAAQSFTVASPEGPIQAVSPPGQGSVHVTVVTPGGTSSPTAGDQFSYAAPAAPPRIHNLSPAQGQSTGGDTLVILVQSTSFGPPPDISAFLFGAIPTKSFSYDPTDPGGIPSGGRHAFKVVTPPNAPGVVKVSLLTTDGGAPGVIPFTYTAAAPPPSPGITALSSRSGSSIGGDIIQIEGTALGEATAVSFGTVPAEAFHIRLNGQDAVAIEAGVPPGKGMQAVTVVTPRGTTPIVDACQYDYHSPSVLMAISFADQPVGTSSAPKNFRIPLQLSLHDLPPDRLVSNIGDAPQLLSALWLAGLGPQFTIGQFIAAFGDVTLSYAIAGVAFARGAGRDFTLQTDLAGGVSITFTPIAAGYRADLVRATVGGIKISGSGLAAQLSATIAPFFTPVVNERLAFLLEGNGV